MTRIRFPARHAIADGLPDLDAVSAVRSHAVFVPERGESDFFLLGPFLALDASAPAAAAFGGILGRCVHGD